MSRVIVLGSINMDVVAKAPRHPQVGETVLGSLLEYFPGGKGANQATASSRLGAETLMIGKVGNDEFGSHLQSFLSSEKINTDHLETSPASTGVALITIAKDDNTIVVVPGANHDVHPNDLPNDLLEADDILVAQLETPIETVHAFFEAGKAVGATTILNPAPAQELSDHLLHLCDVIVLNETELAFYTQTKINQDDDAALAKQLQSHPEQIIVVTLGAQGLITIHEDRKITLEGHHVKIMDTTGAGDCFVGALAVALSEKTPRRCPCFCKQGRFPICSKTRSWTLHAKTKRALDTKRRGVKPRL